jgi:hypothetical protein
MHTDFKPRQGRQWGTLSDFVSPLPGLEGELPAFFQGLTPLGYATLPLRGKHPPPYKIRQF